MTNTTSKTSVNFDPAEIAKFDAMADQWWDKNGPCKPLHDFNPLRLAFIQQHVTLAEQTILDIGCGGGILTESLAQLGAQVTGIDLSEAALDAARAHAQNQQLAIHYQQTTVEDFAQQYPASFDIVTCFEMLEHVPDPLAVIQACAKLVKPNGCLFFSTLNRNLKAYLLAILGAEYLLNILPKGTHDYQKFITPNELATWLRAADIELLRLHGIGYNPLTRRFYLTKNIAVNYLAYCRKMLI